MTEATDTGPRALSLCSFKAADGAGRNLRFNLLSTLQKPSLFLEHPRYGGGDPCPEEPLFPGKRL